MWTPQNNKKFHWISIGVWLLLSCCFAHQFGSFRIIIFVLLQLIYLGGFFSEVRNLQKNMNDAGEFHCAKVEEMENVFLKIKFENLFLIKTNTKLLV